MTLGEDTTGVGRGDVTTITLEAHRNLKGCPHDVRARSDRPGRDGGVE
jgi:hypothetical protein